MHRDSGLAASYKLVLPVMLTTERNVVMVLDNRNKSLERRGKRRLEQSTAETRVPSQSRNHHVPFPWVCLKPSLPARKLCVFVSQLETFLHCLGILDNFDLLGHFVGGLLGARFAISQLPSAGLKDLIVSDSKPCIEVANRLLE